jgi:hypothetical protein
MHPDDHAPAPAAGGGADGRRAAASAAVSFAAFLRDHEYRTPRVSPRVRTLRTGGATTDGEERAWRT